MSFYATYMNEFCHPRTLCATKMRGCQFALKFEQGYVLEGRGPPIPMLQFYLILHHLTERESRFLVRTPDSLTTELESMAPRAGYENTFIITRQQLQRICASNPDTDRLPNEIGTIQSTVTDEEVRKYCKHPKHSDLRLELQHGLEHSLELQHGLEPSYGLTDKITGDRRAEINHMSAIDKAMKRWQARIYDETPAVALLPGLTPQGGNSSPLWRSDFFKGRDY